MANLFLSEEKFYFAVNTYSGEGRYVTMEEFNSLISQDNYWEIDYGVKPISEPLVGF